MPCFKLTQNSIGLHLYVDPSPSHPTDIYVNTGSISRLPPSPIPLSLLPDHMRPPLAGILLLLFFSSSAAAVVNYTRCLEDLRRDPNATGGVDYWGHPTRPTEAVGITYKACRTRCGRGSAVFVWEKFTQLFASCLLPWLALVSQLPFSSGNYIDDLISGWFPSLVTHHLQAHPILSLRNQ